MKSNLITRMITLCMCMVVVGFASNVKTITKSPEYQKKLEVKQLWQEEQNAEVQSYDPANDLQKLEYYNALASQHNGSSISNWTDADYTSELSAEKAEVFGTSFYVPGERDSDHTIEVCSDYYASEGSWDLYSYATGWVLGTQYFSASYECQLHTLTLAPGSYSVDSWDSYGDGGQSVYVDGAYLGASSGGYSWIDFDLSDPAGCDGNEITLDISGGSYCSEISWDLSDGSSGGGCGTTNLCLANGDYTFNGYDSYGDGWNGNSATFSDGSNSASFAVEGSSGSWTVSIPLPAPSCADGEFDCGDGNCIYGSWECDGWSDCADGSDEAGCPSAECADCTYDWTNYGSECCDTAATEFGLDCATLQGTYGWDCSGCNCPLDAAGCSDSQFTCADGSCIPASYYCDGSSEWGNAGWGPDCGDGSDEIFDECCAAGEYADALCNPPSYCEDDSACNTGAEGACEYPDSGYNCDGSCADGYENDCSGACASSSTIAGWQGDGWCDDGAYGLYLNCCDFNMDDGDCGAAIGCDGVASDCGGASEDECGVCGGDGIADGACDCAGNTDAGCGCGEAGPSGCDNACGSTLEDDACGVCGGDGSDDQGCGCFEAGPSGCDNACGSTAANDECGVCGGDNSSCADCAGVPNGDSTVDGCGTCDNDASNDCPEDCFGDFGGDADYDCSGTCVAGWLFGYLGDGWCDGSDAPWGIDLSCYDCDNGDCSGACGCEDDSSCNDDCGVPNGDGSSCADCAGTPNGDAVEDYCGVCEGDNVANDCGEPEGCADGEFDCGDGTCIPGSWECDVYWCDCGDCSDEADCGGDGGDDCVNDDSTSDSYGDTCSSWYDAYESPGSGGCNGNYDDDDFNAAEQCCACQGAASPGDDDIVYSPHAGDKLAQAKLDYIETSETKMNTPVNNNGSRDDCGGTGPDVGCDGVCYSGLEIDECGDCDGGGLNGDGCCYDLATDCNGDCGGDAVTDCSGTCVAGWLMGYLGDGWCDGSDAPWGIDLTCYDCDNGDCATDCNGDCEGTATEDCAGDCGGTAELDFCGVCAGDNTCEEGGDDGGSACEDGYVADCADDDCCPESWIGDGFADCEDQAYGCDLTCYEGETECDDSGGSEACSDCEYDWTPYGSECCDTAAAEYGLSCAALEGNYGWDCSGCNCPLDGDEPEGCADGQYECADGGCIPGSYYCDGSAENGNAGWGPDCADGSDEVLAECCDNGSYDDATCGGGGDDCVDTDNGATDSYGDGCAGYTAYPSWCNGYDDDDFVSADMCCACGGGSTGGGRDDDVSAKPMIYDDAPAKKMFIHIYDLRMAEYDAANASRDSACDGSWAGSDFGCDGVCFSGLVDDECGECGGDGIDEGYCDCSNNIDDCADDDCVAEGWIGDGYCDGSDQAYGADLLCYDCDGGDCMGACGCEDDSSCNDCCDVPNGDNSSCGGSGDVNGDGSLDVLDLTLSVSWILGYESAEECAANEGDINGDGAVSILDIVAGIDMILAGYSYGCTDPAAENYDADADADDGSCTYPCPEGYIDDCVDDDCCPESWIGDGFADCEDQAYGCDLTCYDNDAGDCDEADCSLAAGSFTVAGSDGENDCYDDGSGYFVFDWDGGCLATYIVYDDGSGPAEMDISGYGFTGGFMFYGFAPGTCFDATISFADGSSVSGSACVDCNEAQSCADTTCGYYLNYGYTCDDLAYYSIDCSACDAEGACGGGASSCADTTCGYYLNYGYTCDDMAYYSIDCSACDAEGACDAPEGCADGQFDCNGDGSECIPGGYVCDGSSEFCNASWGPDCSNGADEGLDTCGYDDLCDTGGDDCVDTDNGATDTYGDGCAGYTSYPSWCNGYDDDDFVSSEMCCACGGGSTGGRDADVSNNLKLITIELQNHDSSPQIEGKIGVAKYRKDPADVIQSKAPLGRKASQSFESKLQRAGSVKLLQTAEGLSYEADGFVGFEITLEHGADFTIDVTSSGFIADYNTVGNTTKVVVVNNETSELFSSTGDFEIVDVIAATTGGTALSVDIVTVQEFGLSNAYPNPFNPTTSVELGMPADGFVSVKIYNIMGQVVATLHEGNLTANNYSFTWDAVNAASGMYFLKAETASNVDIQKIMLLK